MLDTWDFGDVNKIDDAEVLDLLGDGEEGLVHLHAIRIPIVTESDDHNFVLFAQDGLKHKYSMHYIIKQHNLVYNEFAIVI